MFRLLFHVGATSKDGAIFPKMVSASSLSMVGVEGMLIISKHRKLVTKSVRHKNDTVNESVIKILTQNIDRKKRVDHPEQIPGVVCIDLMQPTIFKMLAVCINLIQNYSIFEMLEMCITLIQNTSFKC